MEPECYALLRAVEDVHWWHVGMRCLAAAWASEGVSPGGRALDVGCGTGRFLTELRRQRQAWGIDHSPMAAQIWRQENVDGVAQARAQRLPFPDGTFALVTCLDVLYHRDVPDDLWVLREMARVLQPGGVLILRVPALAWMRTARDERFHTRHRYGREELAWLVETAGLTVERLSYVNALLLPLAIIQRWLGHRFAICKDIGDRVPPWILNGMARAILGIEAWWLRGHDLPIGLSLLCRARKPSGG